MRRACSGDFRTSCQGVRPCGGRALGCLAENQSRLSPSCKRALAQTQGQRYFRAELLRRRGPRDDKPR